jgi:hypothetical protein
MSKLTRAARLRSCSLRLPGCQNARETVILAHAPSVESGRGYKSPDWWSAFACSHCHDIVDGRRPAPCGNDVILERWFKGVFETQFTFFNEGLLREE